MNRKTILWIVRILLILSIVGFIFTIGGFIKYIEIFFEYTIDTELAVSEFLKDPEYLDYKITFLFGLHFLSMSLVWGFIHFLCNKSKWYGE